MTPEEETMSDRPPHHRDEKEEEKEEEKRHEKAEKEEKNWEEKWRRDPLGVVVWAAVLIWAGLVLLAFNLDLVRRLALPAPFGEMASWAIILAGAGVILLIEVAIRLAVPSVRRPVGGTIILAVVLLGVGLGQVFGWHLFWPALLIALGLSILLRGLLRRR